jgi:hypothetical protein
MGKRPEVQQNLDFENGPESDSILDSTIYRDTKERIIKKSELGQAGDNIHNETLSLLTEREMKEYLLLKTFEERQNYILRKYGQKLSPPPPPFNNK